MTGAAHGTRPFTLTQFQSSVDVAAVAAPFRRRGKAVNLNIVLASPLTLILQLSVELSDAGICQVVGQVLVLHHALHVQVFHTDGRSLVLAGQIVCQLVNVVDAAVADVLVQPGYAVFQYAELSAAVLLLGESAAQQFQSSLLLLGFVGRLIDLPVAQHGEMLQSRIYADGLIGVDWGLCGQRLLIVHEDAGTIDTRRQQFYACLLDDDAGGTEAAVIHAGDVLDAGDGEQPLPEVHLDAAARVVVLTVALAALDGPLGPLLEEVLVARIEIGNGELYRL